jgi:uncharacterized protein
MKNWSSLYEQVMTSLKEKLSPLLEYHHWKHTEYVILMAEYIAHKENCSEDEILLIKTAALFHDLGFINPIVDSHEDESIRLAQQMLPKFGYSNSEIVLIIGMIQATRIPQQPNNKLEAILADADLEYLGTDDFIFIGNKLFREIKHENPNLTLKEWNQIQIKFLQKHKFHTHYCLNHRAAKKEQNLKQLIQNQ